MQVSWAGLALFSSTVIFSVNACLILFLFFPELQVALKKHARTSPARWKIKAPDCYHYYYTTRHFINTKVWHFPPQKGLLLPFCMATLLNPNSVSEDLHLFKRCCVSKSNLTFHLLWMDPFLTKILSGHFSPHLLVISVILRDVAFEEEMPKQQLHHLQLMQQEDGKGNLENSLFNISLTSSG